MSGRRLSSESSVCCLQPKASGPGRHIFASTSLIRSLSTSRSRRKTLIFIASICVGRKSCSRDGNAASPTPTRVSEALGQVYVRRVFPPTLGSQDGCYGSRDRRRDAIAHSRAGLDEPGDETASPHQAHD